MKRLTFAEQPAMNVHHAGRDTTVRYDDEKAISAGDRLSLRTTDGEQFRTAVVTETVTGSVEFVADVIYHRRWDYPYTDAEELASVLDGYYEPEITPETNAKAVHFQTE